MCGLTLQIGKLQRVCIRNLVAKKNIYKFFVRGLSYQSVHAKAWVGKYSHEMISNENRAPACIILQTNSCQNAPAALHKDAAKDSK